MDTNMQPGDPVRFDHPNGSWGTIVAPRDYDDGFYVRWNYGKDVFGNAITDPDSVCRRTIVPVDPELYARYTSCRAWSDEQKKIREEALARDR